MSVPRHNRGARPIDRCRNGKAPEELRKRTVRRINILWHVVVGVAMGLVWSAFGFWLALLTLAMGSALAPLVSGLLAKHFTRSEPS